MCVHVCVAYQVEDITLELKGVCARANLGVACEVEDIVLQLKGQPQVLAVLKRAAHTHTRMRAHTHSLTLTHIHIHTPHG